VNGHGGILNLQISEQCGSEGWVDGSLQAVARWGEFCFIALEDVENRGADAGKVQRREFLPRLATIFVEGLYPTARADVSRRQEESL
jgi:hypothetical protein